MGSFHPLQEHYLDWSQLFRGSGAAYAPHLGIPSVTHHFKHDGAPARKSKLVKKFMEDSKYQFGSGWAIIHI